jgi:hypothetical protein
MTKGWPVQTIVRGQLIYDNGQIAGPRSGEFIKRPTALHQAE